ncbi:MAG: hypothetical protein H0W83_05705 [Planctomycetes bacterium]|nr:hypothetical protein [Planctomycetota bacterium]
MARHLLLLVLMACIHAAEPIPPDVPVAPVDVPVFDRYQALTSAHDLDLPDGLDPWDPAQVRVDAEITAPDGVVRVQPCFWYVPQEAYEASSFSTEKKRDLAWERFRDAGPGSWCLRFAPDRPGLWRWRWRLTVTTAERTWTHPGGELTAIACAIPGRGVVALPAHGRGLITSDGAPFIPVGINCGWPTEMGSQVYDRWLTSLAAAGGNATRLWLVHYYGGTSLEWATSEVNAGYRGIGHYSNESAERLDRILAAAERRDIKVMLCLFTFGDFAWDWPKNPLATAAGGWLERPVEFFTDVKALTATRNLLRYLVARYGCSRSLWAWELWNEVDTMDGFDDGKATEWHREMARALKQLDAHHHLVTTDYRFTPPTTSCLSYALPDIDFAQLHTYWPLIPEAFQEEHARLDGFKKPIVIGEYGLHVYPESLAADPAGIHLHDGLWGGLFTGACGGGMAWWWDRYVEPRGLWGHCAGLSRFVAGESIADLAPAEARVAGGAAVYALAGPGRAWVWVEDHRAFTLDLSAVPVQLATYTIVADAPATSVTIAGDHTGEWQIDTIDTYDGVVLARRRVTGSARGLTVALAPYRHDVALKATRIATGTAFETPAKAETPFHDRVGELMKGKQ